MGAGNGINNYGGGPSSTVYGNAGTNLGPRLQGRSVVGGPVPNDINGFLRSQVGNNQEALNSIGDSFTQNGAGGYDQALLKQYEDTSLAIKAGESFLTRGFQLAKFRLDQALERVRIATS